MNPKSLISAAAFVLLIAISIFSGPGCANIIPPQGGPRDSLPPILIKATPNDSTRGFKEKRFVLTFNEFVDIQNERENLLISPLPVNAPTVMVRLNQLTVRLNDSLEANTTYSINFGNAIKDYNEGNVLKNFTYTFSTGNYIDSLELKGSVVLAETGKIDTTLIVMLHTNPDDSAVMKDRPRYVTKLDNKGNFNFKNLPPKTFYLYALKDESGLRRYSKEEDLFAFADKPVILSGDTEPVTLYAYATAKPAAPITANTEGGGRRTGPGGIAIEKRLRPQSTVVNGQHDLLTPFQLSFNLPLRKFDSSKIRLYTDSTFIPDPAANFRQDSTGKKLILANTWKPATQYHVIIDKDFAEDSTGLKLLKTDTLSFITKKTGDYGGLQLRFRNLDLAKNPVLLFVSAGQIVQSVPMTSLDFSQALFLPGEYELRFLYDENKNGIWDPGQFFGKRNQPELVKPVERKINIKPNWQNEFEIAL
ncbi:hypothetical protein CAP36_07235 [Chitinophagaceae bacterium IBVUCB2]|nr:hypothetical protein CAP36_07235 [Chitinophagaceae bacterium IBVUCB2]